MTHLLFYGLTPPTFKLFARGGRILLDTVLTQQPLHPNPRGPMLRRGYIGAEAAPGIGQQPLYGFEHARTDRI
jgi:hypothetical protein